MKCPLSGGAGKRLHAAVGYGGIAERCSGARNEGARCDFENDGEVDHVVAGGPRAELCSKMGNVFCRYVATLELI